MASVRVQIRHGMYYDSVVLMQLQKALLALPSILDVGVVMGTEANKDLLRQSRLDAQEVHAARAEDLIVAVKAETESAADAALAQVQDLLTRRRANAETQVEYRPRSLESAAQQLPQAKWVLVSVLGRYAAGVARDALNSGRNVFLYSDNVPQEEEISLKRIAQQKGLLVLGPDCGTAIVNGACLGFANRVRRGSIGVVGASGTGLQAVTVRLHELGAGVSQAIGTGTHDLSDAIGAVSTRQALALLNQDPETAVIILISKPPSPSVAGMVLQAIRALSKPVVVNFIGYTPPNDRDANLYFAHTLSDAAEIAVKLVPSFLSFPSATNVEIELSEPVRFARSQRYLRGLYSGGTLAYEAQFLLREYVSRVHSNAPLYPADRLASPAVSQGHTILDLGADEFTVGRLHPMIDNDLRLRRLAQEADDPEVAVILLDVVLGYGAHPDPASELAPAIAQAREKARAVGRGLEIIAVVIGTDEDPQNYKMQVERLRQAGARVESDHATAVRYAGTRVQTLDKESRAKPVSQTYLATGEPTVEMTDGSAFAVPALEILREPLAAINVGLESFYESLKQQGVPVVHVDWHPPAGGNEKLMAALEKLRRHT